MRRAVLRSNYTRCGSLSRTLNLRNALFLRKEKSLRVTDSLLSDNCSVPSELGNYFARTRVARYAILALSSSLSLAFANVLIVLAVSPRPWIDARTIYIRAFLLRDVSTDGFPRETRKISCGISPRLGSFRVYQTPRSHSFCLPACLFTYSGRVIRRELPITVALFGQTKSSCQS